MQPKVSMRKVGDWKRVGLLLHNLMSSGYKREMNKVLREMAEAYLEKIREHIERQDLGWLPLAIATIAKKGSDSAWFETGYFSKHLVVVKLRGTKNEFDTPTFFVGARQEDIHRPSGLTMAGIAEINEYGKPELSIPARPLFGPTMERIKDEWEPKIMAAIRRIMQV